MRLEWPINVRSIADSVDTRHGRRGGVRARWMLDIGGPFSFVAKSERFKGNGLARVTDSLSNLLALPVEVSRNSDKSVSIRVGLSDDYIDSIIAREHATTTRHKGAHYIR